MIGMRNIVIHDYIKVKLDLIWNTANKDLPILNKNLKKILAEIENS